MPETRVFNVPSSQVSPEPSGLPTNMPPILTCDVRRVVAILRQRYIDADTGSQIESSFAARVTATQRGNSAVKGSSESEQRDDKPDSSSVVKDEV